MHIEVCVEEVPAWLASPLAEFEELFRYPLGSGEFFYVSHGGDYLRFFRAIGVATLHVAHREGKVSGTLVGVKRTLRLSSGRVVPATYVCDLKVRPGFARGKTLLTLGRSLEAQWKSEGGGVGYGVVMDGTAQTPVSYTGRGLLPGFGRVGKVVVLRFDTKGGGTGGKLEADDVIEISSDEAKEIFSHLASGGVASDGGAPSLRSKVAPRGLRTKSGCACGLLSDTCLGKRLVRSDRTEMLAAHLSHFAFSRAEEGRRLLRAALSVAAEEGFPALFVGMPKSLADGLLHMFPDLQPTIAPATIFCHGGGALVGVDWWVHSSEI